jgi:RimJ/RimL family protein N-acetyltransferase
MNFLIRNACAHDTESILSLTMNGIRTWGEDILDKLTPWTEQIGNLAYMEQRLNDASYRSFVAEQNNQVVGSIYIHLEDADIAHMGGLYCSLKRSGIGSALLRKAMSESKDLGYSHMKCEIYARNEASIALMTKHGAVYSHSELYDDVEYRTYVIPLKPNGD